MNLTLENIKSWDADVENTLSMIGEYNPPYPQRPSKPMLNSKHSTEEVLEYAKLLENYDKEFEQYKFNKSLYDDEMSQLNSLKEEFIKDYVDFYKYVPIDKQTKVWNKAFQDGNGWNDVYYQLDSLVELFT